MKNLLAPLLITAALGWSVTACKHPETGAFPAQSTTQFNQETTEKFMLMDPGAQ